MALGLLLFLWQLASAIGSLQQREVPLASPGWLAAALCIAVAGYLLQFGGWLLVMRGLRCPVTASNSFGGYFLSFLPRYIPGTVWGYLGRSEWLLRRQGIGYRRSGSGSLLEAGSFVVTALLLGVPAYLPPAWQLPAGLLLAVGAAAAWPLLARTGGVAPADLQWKLIPVVYLTYFFYWIVQGLGLAAICRALAVGQDVDFLQLTAAAAVGWSAGFLVLFVPSGFGVRELSLTYLLTTQAQMPPADANLVAVLSRLCLILAELLMLGAALLASRRAPAPVETSEP
jgi:hypothetical protein